jgi:hypothetical protein
MLEAIAEGWGIALTDEQTPEIVDRLVAEMTSPESIALVLKRLGDAEREALAFVAATGEVKAHVLTRKYGELRHLGPGRLEWERAWQKPASVVERLWFLGLLYVSYGADERFRGQVFFIPSEILSILPPMNVSLPTFHVEPASRPATVCDEQDALARDAFVILSYLRSNNVRLEKGRLPPRELSRLQPRFVGVQDPQRLAFLLHFCERAGLISKEKSVWKPTIEAATWLKAGALARRQALFHAWLDDSQWNELRLLPGIRCEDTGWHNDPVLARKCVLDYLRQCTVDAWLTLDSFVASVYEVNPDFMRSDGDYDSWYIRDAQTGQYLVGFGHWGKVEGAFIRYILTKPLCWLGVVAVGCPHAEQPADRFMLTQNGAAVLGLREVEEGLPPFLIVQPNLQVVVPREASWYDRFLLERFAHWVDERQTSAHYVINAASVRTCLESGASIEQIIAFLKRATGGRLPNQVERALRAWNKGFEKSD